jgi:hypothetical protein
MKTLKYLCLIPMFVKDITMYECQRWELKNLSMLNNHITDQLLKVEKFRYLITTLVDLTRYAFERF